MIGELNVHRVDICLGVNSYRFDIEFAAGTNDAKGDFAAIGYQDAFEHDEKGMKSTSSMLLYPVI
jgi:hypothetical protein